MEGVLQADGGRWRCPTVGRGMCWGFFFFWMDKTVLLWGFFLFCFFYEKVLFRGNCQKMWPRAEKVRMNRKLEGGGRSMKNGHSFVCPFPSDSISLLSNVGSAALCGLLAKKVCVNTVALEMSSVCVWMLSSSFLPSGLASLQSAPSLALACHGDQFSRPLCALLFLSLKGGRRRSAESDGSVWLWTDVLCLKTEDHCVFSQVNCLWGQGLTQAGCCFYMPTTSAVWMWCWRDCFIWSKQMLLV